MLPRPHFSPFVSPDPPALLAACLDGGATHLEQGPAGHLLHHDLKSKECETNVIATRAVVAAVEFVRLRSHIETPHLVLAILSFVACTASALLPLRRFGGVMINLNGSYLLAQTREPGYGQSRRARGDALA